MARQASVMFHSFLTEQLALAPHIDHKDQVVELTDMIINFSIPAYRASNQE
jgi:hypothetical protein